MRQVEISIDGNIWIPRGQPCKSKAEVSKRIQKLHESKSIYRSWFCRVTTFTKGGKNPTAVRYVPSAEQKKKYTDNYRTMQAGLLLGNN